MGNIFKELREQKGISKSKLAKDLKINRKEILNWENGYRWPNKENAQKLADYYNVSVYNFLEEFKVTEDPDIAEERLKRYGEEISKIYSEKIRNDNNKILIAKLADKKPRYYKSKFDTVLVTTMAIFAIGALTLIPLLNMETEFGAAEVFTIKAQMIDCQENRCTYKVLEVTKGEYDKKYIELPKIKDTSSEVFLITVINDPDDYRIESYIPVTS